MLLRSKLCFLHALFALGIGAAVLSSSPAHAVSPQDRCTLEQKTSTDGSWKFFLICPPPSESSTSEAKPSGASHSLHGVPGPSPAALKTKVEFALFYGNYRDNIANPSGELKLPPGARRMILVSQGNCDGPATIGGSCYPISLLVNIAKQGMPAKWITALSWTSGTDVTMTKEMSDQTAVNFVINGEQATFQSVSYLLRPNSAGFHLEIYDRPQGCRKYAKDEFPESLDLGMRVNEPEVPLDNGVWVGSPKIFDTYRLRQMLADTATQLAAISPWNATAITSAYGSLQGITSDVSYIAAQVTTLPTPTVSTTSNVGGSTSQVLTAPTTGSTTTSTQCPSGYVPTLVGNPASTLCVPNAIAALGVVGTGVSQTSTGATNSLTQGTSNSLQQQVTTGGVAGAIPTVQAPSSLSAPSTVSASAADLLAEQVQLSAQLTVLRLLLQGANSDQLFISHDRAIGLRGQTTLAFPVSLAPQRRYKHAVAEVRVLILPRRQPGYNVPPRMSIVNLLPSEKTYNVAKVTTHASSFGAGVAVEMVNVGAAGGKTKSRLYLAKDTDTVALQFPVGTEPDGPRRPSEAPQEDIRTRYEEFTKWQELGDCPALPEESIVTDLPGASHDTGTSQDADAMGQFDFSSSVMFGWQFRPVLGASDVASNMRIVFAQLALPAEIQADFSPAVFVQTSWREYDSKRQVVGPAFTSSCTWRRVTDAVTILTPTKIKDVAVTDIGSGVVKLEAFGQFFGTNNIRLGPTTTPVQQLDGKHIEYFANAKDILSNGTLALQSQNGSATSLSIARTDACDLSEVAMTAYPQPDGNSYVQLMFSRGSNPDNSRS